LHFEHGVGGDVLRIRALEPHFGIPMSAKKSFWFAFDGSMG